VIVARADVRVADQSLVLLAHHEREFAVCLEANEAVDHVHAGLLKLSRPGDVPLLVEARLDLDQREHLLAVARCLDEGVNDGRVTGGPVERLLDRKHAGIGSGLRQERLHRRRERVVGVVQQHVAARHRLKDRQLLGGLHRSQSMVRRGTERRVLERRPVQVRDQIQAREV